MKYGGKYWNIKKILPYQRCFNLINGERSIGKSYTVEGFFLERALKKGEEFVYLVRTQDEKKKGVFEKAFSKVIAQEFANTSIETTTEEMVLKIEDENGDKIEEQTLGYCLALSEAVKIKKRSFPNVKWLLFDEYMLEEKQSSGYVNGWSEPDLFLSIYHTIDRERDKVICFLLGNNTSFYNPYHMHPAFNIPNVNKGEIWYSENVLFQWAVSTEEMKEDKAKCKFLKMIDKTEYGKYAKYGNYVDDNVNFLGERTAKAKHVFAIEYEGATFGVWQDSKLGLIFIDEKYDLSCALKYALTINDHKENTMLTRNKNNNLLMWLGKNFKLGNVRFVNMRVKVRAEQAIKLIL